MISVEVSYTIENLKRKVLSLSRHETLQRIGGRLVYRLSSFIAHGARSRHKWANKLGADPTGMLEFEPAEGKSTSRTNASIHVAGATNESTEIAIEGVEGIGRAFHDIEIYPRNASALTVPIHKEAYAKTVNDLKREGWHIFRRGRTLVGNHGQTVGGRAVPLFVLCGHVHVPKDEGLLPSSAMLYSWAIDEANQQIESV